jgi:hypothetical protein
VWEPPIQSSSPVEHAALEKAQATLKLRDEEVTRLNGGAGPVERILRD